MFNHLIDTKNHVHYHLPEEKRMSLSDFDDKELKKIMQETEKLGQTKRRKTAWERDEFDKRKKKGRR